VFVLLRPVHIVDERKKERFGRYEILAELGRGAMGIVYKARDPKINRVVAVKTISLASQPPEEGQEYRERFFREAEAAGRLSHPGIVTIFDVGEEPESRSPYIVMEYVPGQTLDKFLLSRDDHKLPPEEALQLALEIAEALDCAHGQGVVHRDIKPANILLTKEGHAKIADFGVAKLNLANATAAGRIFGTPAYMSPEQLNDEEIDGRSDLFSLGVILYTALTGYRPFQGNSAMTVAFKVVNRDPVPATVLDNELPPGLDYIISRAIAKDRSQRYQRGMEMVLDIQELRAGREPWSKAKEPGSGSAPQGANQKPELTRPFSVAALRRSVAKASRQEQSAVVNLLETMRSNKYLVGGVLLISLVVFALRARQVTRPSKILSRNPVAEQSASSSTRVAGNTAASETALNTAPSLSLTTNSTSEQSATKPPTPATTKPSTRAQSAKIGRAKPQPPSSDAPAMLEIEVDHKFAEAHLSIWVDDRLTFTHALEGTDKKRLVVFHHVQGHEFHAVQVPSGKHILRVKITSDSPSSEQIETVPGEFASGAEKQLHIQFDKNGKMNLLLQ
jgi:serine/threonine protein kinase